MNKFINTLKVLSQNKINSILAECQTPNAKDRIAQAFILDALPDVADALPAGSLMTDTEPNTNTLGHNALAPNGATQ